MGRSNKWVENQTPVCRRCEVSTDLDQLKVRAEAAEKWQWTFGGLGGTPEIAWAFYKGLEDNKIAWQQKAEAAEALVAELREALKPFAAEYATWPGGFTESTVPSIVVPGLEPTEAEFTLGDLGRASRLCAKDPGNNASQP